MIPHFDRGRNAAGRRRLLAGCRFLKYNRAMQVHIRLFSRLREHLPREARGEAAVEVPEAATLADLLAHLGIAERVKLISVNGQRETDLGRVLQHGDQVRIFPIVVGG